MNKTVVAPGTGKLLLQKQTISRAQLGAVGGGGEISGLISGALSAIGSASSSLESPSGVVTGAASAALSAYNELAVLTGQVDTRMR